MITQYQIMLTSKQSLTRTTLINMGLRIAMVIIAVTLLSYWHLMSVLQSQTQEQLAKYITERGLRESSIFLLAQDNLELLKQQLLLRLKQLGEQDPQGEFDRLFVRRPDGFIQNRPEIFDGTTQANVFIDKKVILTPAIRRRMLVFYELATAYGTAWHNRFQDTYIIGPENMIANYWPAALNWIQNVININLYMPNDEYFFITDKKHNPARITAWTGIYYDVGGKVWMLSCVKPVDIGERHIATVGHDIVLNELFDRTIADHLQGTYNFIFRDDGRLIVHPDHLNQIIKQQGNFNIAQASDPHLQRIFQLVTHKPANTVVVDNATDGEYLAVTRLQGPNWYFVTVYPKSLLATRAFQTARFIFFLGLLSVLIEVLVLFWVLKKQVAQPLQSFQEATEQLANGDFTVQLDKARQDELGRLANSFQQMAQELRLREEKLAASNQLLSQEIEERKQIEVALMEAKDQAEASNHAKSVFLANMSHELRTPLNGILGYAQIFSHDNSLTLSQQQGVRVIQQSGEYLLTLINDVLDLSKIEAGRLELCPTDFVLPTLLQSLRDFFQQRVRRKGLTFVFETLSPLPTGLYGDDKRLRQILINLLGNAAKFTQQGGVIFQVSYADGHLRCQVSDTGIGIAQAELAQIFLPFHQAGDPKCRPDGTGLGLAITKKLVDLMGGELQVTSQLGQGSTFTVVLALPESTQVPAKETDKPMIIGFQIPPQSPLQVRGEVIILVVDDKWENRSVLVRMLTPLGFKVIEASHGREGLELALRWSPALIISDLVMPVMDGFELARQLRQLPEFQTVPMLAATASVFDLHSPESWIAGYNEVMVKPLHVEQLWEHLQKYLKLTWIYAQPKRLTPNIVQVTSEPEESASLPPGPAKEVLTVLLEAATMGDISGILEKLEKLEPQDPELIPFVTQLRQLVLSFDEVRIIEMLQRYL